MDLTQCPISGKTLGTEYFVLNYNDKEIRFCSEECKNKVKDVVDYLKPSLCKEEYITIIDSKK